MERNSPPGRRDAAAGGAGGNSPGNPQLSPPGQAVGLLEVSPLLDSLPSPTSPSGLRQLSGLTDASRQHSLASASTDSRPPHALPASILRTAGPRGGIDHLAVSRRKSQDLRLSLNDPAVEVVHHSASDDEANHAFNSSIRSRKETRRRRVKPPPLHRSESPVGGPGGQGVAEAAAASFGGSEMLSTHLIESEIGSQTEASTDDTDGTTDDGHHRHHGNSNSNSNGSHPLSATFANPVAFDTGMWGEHEEEEFLRQWCERVPLPKTSLENLHGKGLGRHGSRGVRLHDWAMDWVVVPLLVLSCAAYIFLIVFGEALRYECLTPCGSCGEAGLLRSVDPTDSAYSETMSEYRGYFEEYIAPTLNRSASPADFSREAVNRYCDFDWEHHRAEQERDAIASRVEAALRSSGVIDPTNATQVSSGEYRRAIEAAVLKDPAMTDALQHALSHHTNTMQLGLAVWNYGVALGIVMRHPRDFSAAASGPDAAEAAAVLQCLGSLNVSATVVFPNGRSHEYPEKRVDCSGSTGYCAVSLFGDGIGASNEGAWNFSITVSRCSGAEVSLFAYRGRRSFYIVEAVMRYLMLIACVALFALALRRLRKKIQAGQPTLGVHRLLYGVYPILFLALNPLYIAGIYLHGERWASGGDDDNDVYDSPLGQFFFVFADLPPRLLVVALASYLLSLITHDTLDLEHVPSLLAISIDKFIPFGVPRSIVALSVKVRKEVFPIVRPHTVRGAYDAIAAEYTAELGHGVRPASERSAVPHDFIVRMLEKHTWCRTLLKADLFDKRVWKGRVFAMPTESCADPSVSGTPLAASVPLHVSLSAGASSSARSGGSSPPAGAVAAAQPPGVTRRAFLREWMQFMEEEGARISPASAWIRPKSKAFSTFHFDLAEQMRERVSHFCPLTVRIKLRYMDTEKERAVRITNDVLRCCLSREVMLPHPVFSVSEAFCDIESVLVAAAIVAVVESTRPEVQIRVSGWLPIALPGHWSRFLDSWQNALPLVLGACAAGASIAVTVGLTNNIYRTDQTGKDAALKSRPRTFFDDTQNTAEVLEAAFMAAFAVAGVVMVVKGMGHIRRVPYRHARCIHLLFHLMAATALVWVASTAIANAAKPTRIMEHIRPWRDADLLVIPLCGYIFALTLSVFPPPVFSVGIPEVTKRNLSTFLKESGGMRLRTFRSMTEKLYIDQWLSLGQGGARGAANAAPAQDAASTSTPRPRAPPIAPSPTVQAQMRRLGSRRRLTVAALDLPEPGGGGGGGGGQNSPGGGPLPQPRGIGCYHPGNQGESDVTPQTPAVCYNLPLSEKVASGGGSPTFFPSSAALDNLSGSDDASPTNYEWKRSRRQRRREREKLKVLHSSVGSINLLAGGAPATPATPSSATLPGRQGADILSAGDTDDASVRARLSSSLGRVTDSDTGVAPTMAQSASIISLPKRAAALPPLAPPGVAAGSPSLLPHPPGSGSPSFSALHSSVHTLPQVGGTPLQTPADPQVEADVGYQQQQQGQHLPYGGDDADEENNGKEEENGEGAAAGGLTEAALQAAAAAAGGVGDGDANGGEALAPPQAGGVPLAQQQQQQQQRVESESDAGRAASVVDVGEELSQAFCLETAIHCFHASSLVYEPVLRPTVSMMKDANGSSECDEEVYVTHGGGRWRHLDINCPVTIFIEGRAWYSVTHYITTVAALARGGCVAQEVSEATTASQAISLARVHGLCATPPHDNPEASEPLLSRMKHANFCKFQQNVQCRTALVDTGTKHIFYRSEDPYWGCAADLSGQNVLGEILMEVRRLVNEPLSLPPALLELRQAFPDHLTKKHIRLDVDNHGDVVMALRWMVDSNPSAKQALVDTHPKTLVDLTDEDPVWGVGHDGRGLRIFCLVLMKAREVQHSTRDSPQAQRIKRSFDWIYKTFKTDAVISSSDSKRCYKTPARTGHECEPIDADCTDTEPGETKCLILSTHPHISPPYVVVAFRGTITFQKGELDFRNVGTDCHVTFSDIDTGDGRTIGAHAGFRELYDKVRDKVKSALLKRLALSDVRDDTTLCFTGHSLGGALATLAAIDFSTNAYTQRNVTMYNFGSPRVGDRAFAEFYDTRVPDSFRIVCKGDPVTMLPPMMCYTHVGHSVLMNSLGEYAVDASFAERRLLPYFNPWQHFRLLDSHRRGSNQQGQAGYLSGITGISMKFNLRSRGEIAHRMTVGSRYSPEWARLWASCSFGNPDECDKEFLMEALQFCGEPPDIPVRVPLKLFYSHMRNDHLATATSEHQQWAVSHGYKYVTTLGEVFTFPRGDGRSWFQGELDPLYLYFNPVRNDHMTCAHPESRKFARGHGYREIGVEGFVFPAVHRPDTFHLATSGLRHTWSPGITNHCLHVAKGGGGADAGGIFSGSDDSPEPVDYASNGIDCYIAGVSSQPLTSLFWQLTGTAPLGLYAGLLAVIGHDPSSAAMAACLTCCSVIVTGYLLSRCAVIHNYPRLVDIASAVTYGIVWLLTSDDMDPNKRDMWSVTHLVGAHTVAIACTMFLGHPYTADIWTGDGSVPPGTANQVGFLYFVRMYCWLWLVYCALLCIAVSIPCWANVEADTPHHEQHLAGAVLGAMLLMTLYQHVVIYLLLRAGSSEAFASKNVFLASETVPWILNEFCELFPEPQLLLAGSFTIRECCLSDDEEVCPLPGLACPNNNEQYAREVAELFSHPAARTTVVTSVSEGPDGTWGARIRFTLVVPSRNMAQSVLADVRAKLRHCESYPGIYFPHTMRAVKVTKGWHVKKDTSLLEHSLDLYDATFTRGGAGPPVSQPETSLAFARSMARCLRKIMDLRSMPTRPVAHKQHSGLSPSDPTAVHENINAYSVRSFRRAL